MKPHHYHQLLGSLDRTLEIFDQSHADFSLDDLQLRLRVAVLRADVARFESNEPAPFDPLPGHADGMAIDPEMTPAPWSKIFITDSNQVPPASR